MPAFLTISTGAELICLVVSVVSLKKDRNPIWESQILFMAITCAVELEGYKLKREYVAALIHKSVSLPHGNVWLYNILLILQMLFISLMFHEISNKNKQRKLVIIGGLALLAILYVIDLRQHGIFKKHTNTTLAMSILFIVYSFYFYYQLIRDDHHYDLFTMPSFWWVTGTLFFFFGQIASIVFFQILSTIDIKIITTYTLYKILNVILYSCWSYSFICRKWLQKKSQIYLSL